MLLCFNINNLCFRCWFGLVITGERSCYDEGKRTAETLAMDCHWGVGAEVGYVFVELIRASL